MVVFFRVDASEGIGTGHVMRCLTLADALRMQGIQSFFICRSHKGNMIEYIGTRGYRVYPLAAQTTASTSQGGPNHVTWLGADWKEDAAETQTILRQHTNAGLPDLLIVDHYAIDKNWLSYLSTDVNEMLVIDDLADRELVCDYLLNQNYNAAAEMYKNILPTNARLLLGGNYALLRPQFIQEREITRQFDQGRIFVFFGGGDVYDVLCKTIEALSKITCAISIDVVVGRQIDALRMQLRGLEAKHNVNVIEHTDNMAKLMNKAEFAIAAGGTNTIERLFLGIPTIAISVADNQTDILQALNDDGLVSYLGEKNEITVDIIRRAVQERLDTRGASDQIGIACRRLFIGNTVNNVIDAILGFHVRSVRYSDAKILFMWANDPDTRRQSLSTHTISWDEHISWFSELINDPRTSFYIAEKGDTPIGYIRLQQHNGAMRLSIAIDRAYRGQNIATTFCRRVFGLYDDKKPIVAQVKIDNVGSMRLFEKLGFERLSENDGVVEFRYIL